MPAPFYTANNDFFGQSRNTVGSWASGGGSNSGWNNPWQFQDSNLRYQPYFENSPGGGPGDSGPNYQNPLGWTVYDPSKQNVGDSYDVYDTSGNFLKTDHYKDEPGMLEGMFSDPLFWSFLAAAGGMSAFLPGGWANAGAGTTGGLSEVIGGLDSAAAADLSGGLLPEFGTSTAYANAIGTVTPEMMAAATGLPIETFTPGLENSFRYGYTDGGGIGPGADTTAYNTGSASTPFSTLNSSGNPNAVLPNGSGGGNSVLPTGSGPTTPGGTTGNTTVPTGNGGSGGGGGGGLDLANLIKLLGGAYDMSNADRNTDAIIGWLNSQQNYIDGLYAPGSAEYNALWDQMSRTDAAAGRNSQYGPRSVDLAAKLAGIKGELRTKLATGVADVYSNAINKEGNGAGLGAALSQLFGGQTNTGSSNVIQALNTLLTSGAFNLNNLFSGIK